MCSLLSFSSGPFLLLLLGLLFLELLLLLLFLELLLLLLLLELLLLLLLEFLLLLSLEFLLLELFFTDCVLFTVSFLRPFTSSPMMTAQQQSPSFLRIRIRRRALSHVPSPDGLLSLLSGQGRVPLSLSPSI